MHPVLNASNVRTSRETDICCCVAGFASVEPSYYWGFVFFSWPGSSDQASQRLWPSEEIRVLIPAIRPWRDGGFTAARGQYEFEMRLTLPICVVAQDKE